jgi:inorganic pyrophosphatase/exopolyphosphatase
MKVFTVKSENYSGNYGFAVVETTDDGVILARKDELLETLRLSREEKSLDMMFLAVVNIVELKSTLLVIGEKELSLAKFAFPATSKELLGDDEAILRHGLYNLGGLVSRKKDFVPAISKAINKQGWVPPLQTVSD